MIKTHIYKRKLRAVYLQATDSEIQYGKEWYQLAYSRLAGLHENFGYTCAVCAILSPQKDWDLNLFETETYFKQGNWHGLTLNYNQKEKLSLLKSKATVKEFAKVVYGKNAVKTRDFFYALYYGTGKIPVIDRHMYGACGFDPNKARTDKRTREIKRAIVELSKEYGIGAGKFQAIVWVAYRESILGNKRHENNNIPF